MGKNEPLTLEELKKMNGLPCYAAEEGVWGIVCVDSAGLLKGMPFLMGRMGDAAFCWSIKHRKIACYRRPPGEELGVSDGE